MADKIVKFEQTCASRMVHYNAGSVVELPEDEADELIQNGRCKLAAKGEKLVMVEPPAPEPVDTRKK